MPDVYDVVVSAPHFSSGREHLTLAPGPFEQVAELRPLRTIQGNVVDRVTGRGIAGATIESDTDVETVAARDGAFELDLDPAEWAKEIVIRASGYGTRTIELPKARASVSLDPIPLDRGATVVAHIHQTRPGQVVAAELIELKARGKAPQRVVGELQIAPSDAIDRTIAFENVAPGQYVVMAKGAQASQRAGERVFVEDGDPPAVRIQVTPFRLRLRPMLASRVTLRNHDVFSEASIDVDGEAEVECWQGGRLSAQVQSRDHVPFRARKTIVDPVDTTWDLEMPKLELTGKVVDAESGAAIPRAAVSLEMVSPEHYELTVTTHADEQGVFRFTPVFAGRHTIKAGTVGYPVAETVLTYGEDDERRDVTIAMTKAPMTTLEVKDARGAAIAGADVFVFRGGVSVDFGRTDPSGRWPVFIPNGEDRVVFIVPRDGSLAIGRVRSGIANVTMTVPDGTSRIVIRAESESHEPIASMMVDVRYDGVLLPVEVLQAFAGRGSRTHSGADGRIILNQMPAGAYELTPVAAAATPLRLTATPGENVGVMTFARGKN